MIRCNLLALSVIALSAVGVRAQDAAKVDFAHQIVPILREHCAKCHAGDKRKGGFSINTRELIVSHGKAEKVVIPGKAAASLFIDQLTDPDPEMRMPQDADPLPAEKVALLRAWVDQGLPWEPGFTFGAATYEPPLLPRRPDLPPAVNGAANPIDRLLAAYYARHKIESPPIVGDSAFMRRLYLDVIGLPPTPAQVDAFVADQAPDKRDRLIAAVLADDRAYAVHWLTFWNDLLRNDYRGTGYIDGGRKQITPWLYASLVANKPYDQFVRELVSPTGASDGFISGIKWRGRVNASQTREVQFAQNVSQVFLGINMKCASCHDSFIDDWKLTDAYALAAVVADGPVEINRCDVPTGEQARAAFMFPQLGQIDPAAPRGKRLEQLASLMTSPDNGRTTRTIVNRLWHRMMGRGIVHPVDAMATRPWDEDLLDYLAVRFADDGHDIKKMIALIASSRAYQSRIDAREAPAGEDYIYAGPIARRMTAEQFMDAVWALTAAGPKKVDAPGVPAVGADVPAVGATAKWIWTHPGASSQAPERQQITFRAAFTIDAVADAAALVITCDNEYAVWINGKPIAGDAEWASIEIREVASMLRQGENEIVIGARNLGAAPNPAGLIAEIAVRHGAAWSVAIATDATWQWAPGPPDASGRTAADAQWKPAGILANQSFLGDNANRDFGVALGRARRESRPDSFVRAALVNSDPLMRSLGRPNREQVVTTRPDDLSTLQALDLSNGAILSETVARGAKNLLAMRQWTPDELVDYVYLYALSRRPTGEERPVARAIVGEPMTEPGAADLLWAVFMLPEFQLIR